MADRRSGTRFARELVEDWASMIVKRLMLAIAILTMLASAGCAANWASWASDPAVPHDATSHEAGGSGAA